MTTAIEPETAAAIDRQVTAFTNRYGGKFPALAEDIQQEAWSWALKYADKYDPAHPGAKGFFYMIAHRHVPMTISRWISPTSQSNYSIRTGIGLSRSSQPIGPAGGIGRSGQDGPDRVPLALQAPEASPDRGIALREGYARLGALEAPWRHTRYRANRSPARMDRQVVDIVREATTRLKTVRTRWRTAVRAATADLSPQEREVGALAHGLDGPPRGPAWVARRLGIWRDEVERAAKAFEKAIRKPAIRKLKREIDLLEGILP